MILQKYTHTYHFSLKQRKRTLYMKNNVCKFRNIKHENPFGASQIVTGKVVTKLRAFLQLLVVIAPERVPILEYA